MTPSDLKLRGLLVEILLIDDDQYRDSYGPDDIETWDSLASVRIACAVEEEFGYAMSPEELASLGTIGDIKNILRQRQLAFD